MTEDERRLFRETLEGGAAALGLTLPDDALDACAAFADRLLHTNTQLNLTRITEPGAVAVKHFVDSLTPLVACPGITARMTLADVGTGAGFPGVPLRIVRPDLRVTLLDSVAKRLAFVKEALDAIDVTGVTLVHVRAEDAGRAPAFRDRYDLVTARAVAALPVLLEWCGPLVAVGGRFVAMKGGGVDDELNAGASAARRLGLTLEKDAALTLPVLPGDDPDPAQRRLLVYRKTRPTPPAYPRRAAEIKAQPLG